MDSNTSYITYKQTGYFSKIVIDYLDNNTNLQPFYHYQATKQGIKNAIESRKKNVVDRKLLHQYFTEQYNNKTVTAQQSNNISLLLNDNCYTITTAHQPNIFTGPLYFIYKILHTIKLADELNKEIKDSQFVPVYFMGSEDADLDELGTVNIQGKQLLWNTKQTGAVGRMKVDKAFMALMDEIEAQIAVNPFGIELMAIFKNAYQLNVTIQNATFSLVNSLFAQYGLLVLISDNAHLKRAFVPTITKELTVQFSRKLVDATNAKLSKHYKTQAAGRDINLFYLLDDHRERIELKEHLFVVEKLGLSFTLKTILAELKEHPERFSPNVILRPVFQETILPNVAFIGGGGELAYWLQLKLVFDAANIPYPVLVLRNSFLFYNKMQEQKLAKMNYHIVDIFQTAETLLSNYVVKHSENDISLNYFLAATKANYAAIKPNVAKVDETLVKHLEALTVNAIQKIEELEKKMLRAEKRKYLDQKNQLINIKKELFPNDNLQERIENMAYLYARFGNALFDTILAASTGLQQEFGLIALK